MVSEMVVPMDKDEWSTRYNCVRVQSNSTRVQSVKTGLDFSVRPSPSPGPEWPVRIWLSEWGLDWPVYCPGAASLRLETGPHANGWY